MKIIKNVIATAVIAAASLMTTNVPSVAQSIQDITERGTIRVGFIPSPPGIIRDPASGELHGFYVAGMNAIAEQMDVEVEYVETTWGTFVAALQSEQIDLSIAGTFATIQRALAVDFTRPIFYLGYGALVRTDDERYQNLEDMNNPDTRIAVVQGGAAEDYVRRNMPDAQVITLATGNLGAPFVEVLSNRADVAIEDAYNIDNFVRQQSGVRNLFEGNPYNLQPIAWAVANGNQSLREVMNIGIESLLATGAWDKLAREYGEPSRYISGVDYVPFPRPVAGVDNTAD